jgi:hypothetical protein
MFFEEMKPLLSIAVGLTELAVTGTGITSQLFPQRISAEKTPPSSLSLLEEVTSKSPKFVTMILDEANKCLGGDSPETNDVLDMLVLLSKQNRKMNVILFSSEHSFPFHQKQQGFNITNLTRTIFAGEVPPSSMRSFLTGSVGMGPHLSTRCMESYGGHIWNTYNAMSLVSFTIICTHTPSAQHFFNV